MCPENRVTLRWSLTRIGDHFGKDHTVVRNALLRAGVTLRPP
jgi:chromosomal replication initiation ATPase DnaA